MDQFYFESGYIDDKYFTAEYYAEASLDAQSSVDCIIGHLYGVDMSAFSDAALTTDAVVLREVSASLDSASLVEAQALLIADRDSTISSEFAQSTLADRTRDAAVSITANFAFDSTVEIITPTGQLKEFAAAFASAFEQAQTVELYKEYTAGLEVVSTISETYDRIRDTGSLLEIQVAQEVATGRIVQGACDFSSLFTPSASIDGVKNTFAILDSTSALATVAIANRSADIALSSIVNQSLQGDRIRDYAVDISSAFAQTVNYVNTRPASATIDAVSTITADNLRNRYSTANISSAFTPVLSVQVTKTTSTSLNSTFTQTTTANATKRSVVNLLAFASQLTTGDSTVKTTVTVNSSMAISVKKIAGITKTLSSVASLSTTTKINPKPSILYPTRYTGFDVSFQFKFTTTSDRVYVEAMNPVHDDADILRMISITSATPEIYSGIDIKLAADVTFTAGQTKNISLVGGGSGLVGIKSGERFHLKIANTSSAVNAVDNNRYFTANQNITDASTSVSVTAGPSGGGTFTTNHQIVSWYVLPNAPLSINIYGPNAAGGTGTSRIGLGWWSADKETVAAPLNRIYAWDQYYTNVQNISASAINTWHTCRVYADSTTWPNVVLQINGSNVSLTPLYSTSLNTYAPYPTVTEPNIFGTIDSIQQYALGQDGLIQNTTIAQNGTYNSYPQEIGVATLTAQFSATCAPAYVKQAASNIATAFTQTTNAERKRTPGIILANVVSTLTAQSRTSYEGVATTTTTSTMNVVATKIARTNTTLSAQFTETATPRRNRAFNIALSSTAAINANVDRIRTTSIDITSTCTLTSTASRTRPFSTAFQVIASDLTVVVKTGRGIVHFDSVTTQVTLVRKITDVICNMQVTVDQSTIAVKTVTVESNIDSNFDIDADNGRLKDFPTIMSSAFSPSIDTLLSRIRLSTAQLSLVNSAIITPVKITEAVTTMSVLSTVTFGNDVRRVRLADSQQTVTSNALFTVRKIVYPQLNFEAIATEMVTGNVVAFDQELMLRIPYEYRTLQIPEEHLLLMVPEETRVNMVRKIAQ